MAIKLIRTILYIGLWLSSVAIAFHTGTFYPNSKVVLHIENNVIGEMQQDFAKHNVTEPKLIYNDNESFMQAVYKCVNFVDLKTPATKRVHKDIIIAMAVLESGYGTSRFATKGNNLFGIRTWDKSVAQMKPKENPNAEWGVKVYITKCQSVADMVSILNRLEVYKDFRNERQMQLELGIIDVAKQIDYLGAWSTNPQYTELVKQKAKEAAKLFSVN